MVIARRAAVQQSELLHKVGFHFIVGGEREQTNKTSLQGGNENKRREETDKATLLKIVLKIQMKTREQTDKTRF